MLRQGDNAPGGTSEGETVAALTSSDNVRVAGDIGRRLVGGLLAPPTSCTQ